jgi:hypothetical protein
MSRLVLSADWIETWRRWAALGTSVTIARQRQMTDWRSVARMVEAAKKTLKGEATRLRSLLAESDRQLAPWGEPLTVDLGMHRWLAADREEAYSDWLAWVVEQLKTPDLVFRLFGQPCCSEWSAHSPPPAVYREPVVPFGHAGHEGRLDLLIDYPSLPLLVIEVKKGDAERADKKKQEGYRQSLKERHPTRKLCPILLVTSAKEATSDGDFVVRTWAEVCVELRRMAGHELKDRLPGIAVALILAFVAAVEENLLGFSSELVRRIKEDTGDSVYFFNTNVVNHIDKSLLPEARP